MKILRNISSLSAFNQGTAVTIGNFDGVHLGHQALLSHLRKKADFLKLPLAILLFEPQPAEFFQQENAPHRLSSLREKCKVLAECLVDYVILIRFDAKLAETDAKHFATKYFFSNLNAKLLMVGEDFRFGYNRTGDLHALKALGEVHGCQVEAFCDHKVNHERVSSTKIRKILYVNDFAHAKSLLGRSYSLLGRVIYGKGLGRKWGIPTANIRLSKKRRLILRGVFCVKVRVGLRTLYGVANIGNRPTVDGSRDFLEIHILNCNEVLYGQLLEVFFLKKLRDEKKFDSIDALIVEIRNDITNAEYFFKSTINELAE